MYNFSQHEQSLPPREPHLFNFSGFKGENSNNPSYSNIIVLNTPCNPKEELGFNSWIIAFVILN